VDVGQFVPLGFEIARIYAVDYVEIALPIPNDEAAFADIPVFDDPAAALPEVVVTARYGEEQYAWTGRIVRTEGAVDPRSRVLYAVARVDAPYVRSENGRPPLAVGMYVDADIAGRTVHDVFVIPRSALLNHNRVLIVDESGRLRIRSVDIIRVHGDDAVIRSGLQPGDRLCLTRLDAPVDGMEVRPVTDAPRASEVPGGGL